MSKTIMNGSCTIRQDSKGFYVRVRGHTYRPDPDLLGKSDTHKTLKNEIDQFISKMSNPPKVNHPTITVGKTFYDFLTTIKGDQTSIISVYIPLSKDDAKEIREPGDPEDMFFYQPMHWTREDLL